VDLTGDDEDSNDSEVNMAECGACRAVIPIDSASCSECGVSFSGVADDDMGECGACGTLVPIDSKSCSQCGVHFVLDDLTTALSIWMKDEGLTITELFGMVDADNDGSLTSAEVKDSLMDRNLAFLGADELDRFLSQIDLNDDGVISFPELAAALSMPWTPPKEAAVLEPESTDDDTEDEDGDDEDSEDGEADEVTDSDDDDSEEDETDDDADSDDEDSDEDEDETGVDTDLDDDSDDDDSEEDADDDDDAEDDGDSEDADSDEDDDSDDEDSDEDETDVDADSDDDSGDDDSEEEADDDDADAEDDGDSEDEESDAAPKSDGPPEWQRFLMRNYENAFPILYTLGAIFVGIWLVNAMGILVDGSGGPVAYNGVEPYNEFNSETFETTTIQPGEIYDCRDDIQDGGCKNSLTPLAGENGASSMPAGFYWDGIMFMVLGLIGLGGIGYLQMQIKQMRDDHRRGKSESSDDGDGSDDDSEDESEDSEDSEDSDDSDDEDDGDSDDDDSDDDGIEIGSRVGVEDEDGDWYGKVVEFDDDEDAVVVKREDDGEEYVVDWESLFQDD
jgi:hypothetical protein